MQTLCLTRTPLSLLGSGHYRVSHWLWVSTAWDAPGATEAHSHCPERRQSAAARLVGWSGTAPYPGLPAASAGQPQAGQVGGSACGSVTHHHSYINCIRQHIHVQQQHAGAVGRSLLHHSLLPVATPFVVALLSMSAVTSNHSTSASSARFEMPAGCGSIHVHYTSCHLEQWVPAPGQQQQPAGLQEVDPQRHSALQ